MDQRRDEVTTRTSGTSDYNERAVTDFSPGSTSSDIDSGEVGTGEAIRRNYYRPYGDTDYDRGRERNRSAEDVEREIERTRNEMSHTINEIEERFSPRYIKNRVKEGVKGSARDAGNSFVDLIKENPIPSILTGIGLGWLVTESIRGRSHEHSGYYSTGYGHGTFPEWNEYRSPGYRSSYAYGEPGYYGGSYSGDYGRSYYGENRDFRQEHEPSMGERARSMAGDVQHRASEAADEARRRASHFADEARDRASHFADEARDRFYQARYEARYRGRRAVSRIEQMMDENPLGAGAIALGLGAFIGMLFPSTQVEREWMGPARDQFMEEARERAENTFERAKDIASESVQHVKEEAKHASERMKDAARDEVKSTSPSSSTT